VVAVMADCFEMGGAGGGTTQLDYCHHGLATGLATVSVEGHYLQEQPNPTQRDDTPVQQLTALLQDVKRSAAAEPQGID
jgi:hypothetical protein